MSMTLTSLLALSAACAPMVAPQTLLSVVKAESGFDPLTIGVNGARPRALHPASASEAVRRAGALIAAGASVDLGVGQINSRNLQPLGLSLEDAFDPCRNLAAAARLLAADYAAAAPGLDRQAALRVALSLYNTGDARRGFRNGYVRKIGAAAQYVVPAIAAAGAAQPARLDQATPEPAAWDVFARARTSPLMVFPGGPAARPHRPSKPSLNSPGARR